MPDHCLHCTLVRAVYDHYAAAGSIDVVDACTHLTEVMAELVASDPDPATRGEVVKSLAELLVGMVEVKRRRGQHPEVRLNS